MKKELEQIRALAMELLGFNLPNEAVSKIYEIRDICTKKLNETGGDKHGSAISRQA